MKESVMEPVREIKYKKPNRCLYMHVCGCSSNPESGQQHHRSHDGTCSCGRWGICCVVVVVVLVLLAAIAAIVLLALYFTTQLLPLHYDGQAYTYASTEQGQVKGRLMDSPGGKPVEEYLGIPFAQPPVGDLRFADPVPLKQFSEEPYEATRYSPSCMQGRDNTQGDFWGTQMWNPPGRVSEDCLYLNVWTPTPKQTKLRPVMVWVYGGGFTSGTASLDVYDGKVLAAYGDVVVVSMNYRLGALGFLATGDGRIKGNFGLKDQAVALQWIHDNIASFGGDPAQVTLFGESAGGVSVGFHMLSPITRDLFNRAILASSSPGAYWAVSTDANAKVTSEDLIKNLNCTPSAAVSTLDLMECLRSKDAAVITKKQNPYPEFMRFPFRPVVDGDFLTDTPYNLLQDPSVLKKDILLGSNKDEGSFWLLYWISNFSPKTSSMQTYDQFLAAMDIVVYDLNDQNKAEVIELYTNLQIKDTGDQAANRDAVDRNVGDRWFTCPTWDLARDLSQQGQAMYYYYLTYRASNAPWPEWMGVIHGADCQWMFGNALVKQTKQPDYNEDDKSFARAVMSYISNFAKTGDPNASELPSWPKFQRSDTKYLEWRGAEDFRTNSTFREPFCEFWRRKDRDFHEGRNIG